MNAMSITFDGAISRTTVVRCGAPPRIKGLAVLAILAIAVAAMKAVPAVAATSELTRLQAEADRVVITRDDWGIAHVHGKTDADAVFGMIYAQAEDDFNRVETNYLTSLGRRAEAEGEAEIWSDLRQRLFVDPADLKSKYAASPVWLKALMNAWADGLNFYLATHPQVHPKAIRRFEPWMPLSFAEGSVGGDISNVSLADLEQFYGAPQAKRRAALEPPLQYREPPGSNGIALAPAVTQDGHALLLINPHTPFYFRSELQMTSDAGLNVYGAATWGQFFIYQGFNPHAGWMHTTSSADCMDEFAETIVERAGRYFYRYGSQLRPVRASTLEIGYRDAAGSLQTRRFTIYRTHHGPIVRSAESKWIAVALMNRPVNALEQSFGRTKAHDLKSFMKVAALAANSSNDTVFADDTGEIALLLPQFVPLRDNQFDYTKPVDGANPATDWRGTTPLAQLPAVINPRSGWLYNSNDGPWWAADGDSPQRESFPRYMDQVGAVARTAHAIEVLKERRGFTLQKLIDAAYDSHLPTFAKVIPPLVKAYDGLPGTDPLKSKLAAPVAVLRSWDDRWSEGSVATALAVTWAETMWFRVAADVHSRTLVLEDRIAGATATDLLNGLSDTVDLLVRNYGDWKIAWGSLNRFQRIDDAIVPHFDDAAPSMPVPFTSSQWGSLASFDAKPNSNGKVYGKSGNSFVAVVEFGPRVRARAVLVGGESGDVASKHFRDQAQHYAAGDLRPVYFYPDELVGHTERTYRPGQ